MADFDKAILTILRHEGKLSNDANDPGGITNFGISLRFLMQTGDLDLDGWRDGDINHDKEVNAKDVRSMTQKQAIALYHDYFWNKNAYAKIGDQFCATKIFDLSVNMGSYAANRVAQHAVRSAIGLVISDDGIIGNKSLTALNMCHPSVLMAALKSEAAGYYRSIRYRGSQDFLKGWLNRAYDDCAEQGETDESF